MRTSSPGFVEHDDVRIVDVTGSDARGWLNDLVTGPVGSLGPKEATRSLLLTPTGRIRADFFVVAAGGGEAFRLLQDRGQPEAIDQILAPYVLSSDVELSDASERLALFSIPGVEEAPVASEGVEAFAPSMLGPGAGLLVDRGRAPAVSRSLSSSVRAADRDALERWRIESGIPRCGTDFDIGALPAEASLESAIDLTKGCFLGQESVAKVRNLGHPSTVLVALHAPTTVGTGDGVYADGTEIGNVTSVAPVEDGGTTLFARVRFDAAHAELSTYDGAVLSHRSVNATRT
ncbi:MAG: YgfZ/GcvT domain-containing protein [Actinomycetota bacterium]